MSGYGERFCRAGYSIPKPLIEVDGKPIIAHVMDLFPGEKDFLFICNREHLRQPEYRMREILQQYCPAGEIYEIAPHNLGPVYAVSQVLDKIDPEQPVIVNYADFSCYWDYANFKRVIAETTCDGCIPAYRGFHPHSLGCTYYAYLHEKDDWLIDIQEKQPFTDQPMREYASSGTYYFAKGEYVHKYFIRAMKQDLKANDEFYVSLVYKPMLEDNKRIIAYEIEHFMQWGTPQDLREYLRWSNVFRALSRGKSTQAVQQGTVMIPMAGEGSRFKAEAYTLPKPLIPVSNRPMFVQAARDLPHPDRYRFILRRDMQGVDDLKQAIQKYFTNADILVLNGPTDGQASTCLLGLEGIDEQLPLTIGACDNGAIYDSKAFQDLMQDTDTDVIVWVMRGHLGAIRYPEMYGWVEADKGRVIAVSVKRPLSDPTTDPIIIGTFTFKRAADYKDIAIKLMQQEDNKINGEYYVDSTINQAIELGLTCKIFGIDHYLGWGTPDDLSTFEYWQSCFHKWPSHEYSMDSDEMFPLQPTLIKEEENAIYCTTN